MSKAIDNPQNLELSQCVKTISEFGSNTYQNICTGASETVHWGLLDWVGVLTLLALGIGFVLMMIVLVLKMADL